MLSKCRCCCLMWLSGFFGLAAVIHIIRLITQVQVQIGDFAVPMKLTVLVLVVTGVLSALFAKLACGKCSCSTK